MIKNNSNISVTLECEALSNEGKGIVHYNNKTGFIDNFLPSEKAEILITYIGKNMFFGKVKKLIVKSPYRVEVKCKAYNDCGGCSLMHLDYQEQLKFKKMKVQDCLKRVGHIDVNVDDTVGMEEPYHYRNKIQMPIKFSKNNQIVSGFYKEKTHSIVPIETCLIENVKADKILKSIKILMKKFRVNPYDEDRRTGIIRHILIRTSYHYDEIMVVLVTNCDSFPGRQEFVKSIKRENSNITTIVQNINPRDTNVILGERERILFGKGYIKDILCGIEFKISPKSFFQVNPLQTEKLYSLALNHSNIKKDDVVLDAYCGIGTIGLVASKSSKKVLGVEVVKEAVIDALNNIKNNNIENVKIFNDDAGDFIIDCYKQEIYFDVVIMDPPRKGSSIEFINILKKTKPKTIIYISCDPATLARDLNHLKSEYDIKKVIPVDMFPQTIHVETIAVLSLKNEK